MGAFQVRYMPLALSLSSDCLKFQLFPLQNPPRDRAHSSQSHPSQFCTAAHCLWDSAVQSRRYFCSWYTGHGKTHQKKEKYKNKQTNKTKNMEGNSQLASSASLQGWNKPLQSCPCAQEQPGAGREPHTCSLSIPLLPCHSPAPTEGHEMLTIQQKWSLSFAINQKEKKIPYSSTKVFKNLSPALRLNLMNCFVFTFCRRNKCPQWIWCLMKEELYISHPF